MNCYRWILGMTFAVLLLGMSLRAEDKALPKGFTSLFNGKDLTGWKVPEGDNGHWKVKDGVIDYDSRSEAKKDKDLWSEKSFRDFVLRIDWRLKKEPGFKRKVPEIGPNGEEKKGADGKPKFVEIEDLDSGIYLRGSPKSQVNICMWPLGSGEVWGYRTDRTMPAVVRAGVTPKRRLDKPQGEWNTFEITLKGDRLSVKLNGEGVLHNARLPGVPREGPLGLQHHASWDKTAGKWTDAPSLIQFRNIYIKELD
jgi:Domain of Unknown Function (DUF1080)